MPLILSGNVASATAGAYEVANSCRFNPGDTAYMHKTPGSDGNKQKFTFSTWIKFCDDATTRGIFSAWNSNADASHFNFTRASTGKLTLETWSANVFTTNRVFRDVSAWFHLVLAVDTTQGTDTNRIKLYVNGVQETSFSAVTYPSQNDNYIVNTQNIHVVGGNYYGSALNNAGNYYLAETVFIDNAQLTPTSFGEFDEDSPTIWKPINVSGLTFGTNGFYLDFEASDNLGNDANGGTDLTEVNLAAADQTTDTPTNNFATLNSLGFGGTTPTFSQGNLNASTGSGASLYSVPTIGVSSGKWYVEGELEASTAESGTYYHDFGFADRTNNNTTSIASSTFRVFWLSSWDGKINYRTGGSTTAGLVTGVTIHTPGDFLQLYLDMDNELMYWGRNGALLNSTGVSFNGKESQTGEYFFAFGDQFTNGTTEYAVNFGQGSIDGAAVTAHNDANGYGNFKYDPSVTTDEGDKDFLALCTKNLAEYGG